MIITQRNEQPLAHETIHGSTLHYLTLCYLIVTAKGSPMEALASSS